LIGELLGKRYKILEKIGEGGMALVYKARCSLLNRIVAVKVLKPQYSSDEEFVKRFRREAQAAASLSHPNIVNIYDVGKEQDIDYIVMEYVEGKTLKDIIKEEAPLEEKKAINIALQICDALFHAHKNHIIHRDIKPHNIIITEDNRVKVTDFGIARAATSSTLTDTGSVYGSVHYFSPEQARGGYVNEKSDLYSLGVVMYEMLTGRVPFKGNSPICVALKHLNEKVPPLSEYNKEISRGLEAIVLKAMAKDQCARYNTALELKNDLLNVSHNPNFDISEYDKDSKNEETKILPAVNRPFEEADGGEQRVPSTKGKKTKTRKKKSFLKTLLWLFVLSLLVSGMMWGGFWIKDYLTVPLVEVPDVIGMTEEEAAREFRKVNLRYEVAERVFDESPAGIIIDQSPKGGETVKVSRPPISVWISKGPKQVTVPNLIGKTEREAEVILSTFELKPGFREEVYSDNFPKGVIIDQNPRASITVKTGTEVDYTVSLGKEPQKLEMPNLIGMDFTKAQSVLNKLGLEIGSTQYKESHIYFSGQVLDQTPAPKSQVTEGQKIDLIISKGPGPERKSVLLEVVLPSKPQKMNVKVIVKDRRGQTTVYNKNHTPDDSPLKIQVEGVGESKAEVYINGNLWGEQTF